MLVDRALHQATGAFPRQQVDRDGRDSLKSAEALDGPRACDHVRAFRDERSRDREANALACAGDDDDLVRKL